MISMHTSYQSDAEYKKKQEEERNWALVVPYHDATPLVSMLAGGLRVRRDKLEEAIAYLKSLPQVTTIRVYVSRADVVRTFTAEDGAEHTIYNDSWVIYSRARGGTLWSCWPGKDIEYGCPGVMSVEEQCDAWEADAHDRARRNRQLQEELHAVPPGDDRKN